MARKGPGRPTKLTDETIARLTDAIRAGNYIETAAAYCGIDSSTLRKWMKDGRAAKGGKKRELVEAVEQALAASEVRDVLHLAQSPDWKARAFKLARRFPERWGQKTEVQHTGSVDLRTAFQDTMKALDDSPDEAFAMARAWAKHKAAKSDAPS